jgi:hypothetical protein
VGARDWPARGPSGADPHSYFQGAARPRPQKSPTTGSFGSSTRSRRALIRAYRGERRPDSEKSCLLSIAEHPERLIGPNRQLLRSGPERTPRPGGLIRSVLAAPHRLALSLISRRADVSVRRSRNRQRSAPPEPVGETGRMRDRPFQGGPNGRLRPAHDHRLPGSRHGCVQQLPGQDPGAWIRE